MSLRAINGYPSTFSPLIERDSLIRGGKVGFRPKAGNFLGFWDKNHLETLRKRSKTCVFWRENCFFEAWNPKNFAPAARLHSQQLFKTLLTLFKLFENESFSFCSWSGYYPSNFQIYRRLSRALHMHKTFLTVWLARWDLIIFGLRAATVLSTHVQTLFYCGWPLRLDHVWLYFCVE